MNAIDLLLLGAALVGGVQAQPASTRKPIQDISTVMLGCRVDATPRCAAKNLIGLVWRSRPGDRARGCRTDKARLSGHDGPANHHARSIAMDPAAYFHADSMAVRFWVEVAGLPVGASVGQAVLHYRFQPGRQDDDPMSNYQAHSEEIHAAVRRRVAQGSIEPVMLREHDLLPLPAVPPAV